MTSTPSPASPDAAVVGLDPRLLAVLACPTPHRAALRPGRPGAPATTGPVTSLFCPECRRVFPVRDGIPVLLLDEAEPPDGPGSS